MKRKTATDNVGTSTTGSNMTVTFDIGGTKYRVSRTLIEAFPESMLCSISSERWKKGCKKKDDIFIDRNGSRFEYVLDYMRDSEVNFPCSVSKHALLNDFEYYGFKIDASTIKTQVIHPSDVAEQVNFWKKRRTEEINRLDTLVKSAELNKKTHSVCS
jgi:BTB/POZ domain